MIKKIIEKIQKWRMDRRLKKKLKILEKETLKNKKLQDEVNQDINELSQETDSLVEEIDKWQT